MGGEAHRGTSAASRGPGSFPDLPHTLLSSGLCFGLLPHQETSKYLVKRESVTHTIPLLMGHPPRSSPPAVWLPQVSRTVTLFQLILEDGTKNLRAYWKTFSSIASDLQWFLLKCFNVQTVTRLKKKKTWSFPRCFWRYEDTWPPMTGYKYVLKSMNKMLTLFAKRSAQWESNRSYRVRKRGRRSLLTLSSVREEVSLLKGKSQEMPEWRFRVQMKGRSKAEWADQRNKWTRGRRHMKHRNCLPE